MDLQAQDRAVVGGEPVANDDDCDLNDLARSLRRQPGNLLPPEPFPSGFDLGALATSRSSRPPEPDPEDDAEARVDLRGMARGPSRTLPPRKRSGVVDLAPVPPPAAGVSSVPPRSLPPRKRSGVVDLAPVPVQDARPQPSEHADELDALIARRAFAGSTDWAQHAARVAAVAQKAPKWAWAAGGALLMAFAWVMSGSDRAPAAVPIAVAAIATSPVATQPAPTTLLASIFPHTNNVAAAPRDTRLAYERARPAPSRPEATPAREPAGARAQAPAPQPAPLSTSPQERSIDTLLDQALRNEGSPIPGPLTPRAKAGSGLQQIPSRAVVANVLGGQASRMRLCAGSRSGVAIAHVVVRKDGGVASARVSGAPFSGGPAGSCMETVLRQARFPAFDQPTFSVTYPFQL